MEKITETLEEVLTKWRNGEVVWSAELGGMGPGYEQAIQVLLFEICARWGGKLPEPTDNKYPPEFLAHVERVAHDLKDWGFSGAQVGQAQATAFQFLYHGYADMMAKLPEDRRIMVCDSLLPKPVSQ